MGQQKTEVIMPERFCDLPMQGKFKLRDDNRLFRKVNMSTYVVVMNRRVFHKQIPNIHMRVTRVFFA